MLLRRDEQSALAAAAYAEDADEAMEWAEATLPLADGGEPVSQLPSVHAS